MSGLVGAGVRRGRLIAAADFRDTSFQTIGDDVLCGAPLASRFELNPFVKLAGDDDGKPDFVRLFGHEHSIPHLYVLV